MQQLRLESLATSLRQLKLFNSRASAVFAKTAEALELKCGVVEGTYYDAAGIQTIASIPSRDELLSKFLGSIQSPITNFARVIKQIAEKNEEVA